MTNSSNSSSSTVPVRLLGGPDDWHGRQITNLYTPEHLAGPRDDLGTYLISDHVPDGMADPGARAVYEPDMDPQAPADTWWFRGWFPSCPNTPEYRQATDRCAIDGVVTDGLGVPVYWYRDGDPAEAVFEASRLLVHWEADAGEGLPAVWRVRALAPDGSSGEWELCEAAGEWTAGPLPEHEAQAQEYDDLLD